MDKLADVADNWKCITSNLNEEDRTLLARKILEKNLRKTAVIKEIATKGLAPSKTN